MENTVFWSPCDEKEVEFPSSIVLSSSVLCARDMGWKMRSKCAPKTLPKQWIIYFLIKCSNRLTQPMQPAYLWVRSTTKEPLSPHPDAAHVSEKPSNLLLRNRDSSVLVEGGSNQAVFNSPVLTFRNLSASSICTCQLHHGQWVWRNLLLYVATITVFIHKLENSSYWLIKTLL